MYDEPTLTETSLWRRDRLTPPTRIEKMSKPDLERWRQTVAKALQRHEYLLSCAGQQMIVLGYQQSIARLQAAIADFESWLRTDAEESYAHVKQLAARLDALDTSRLAEREARKCSTAKQSTKLAKAQTIIGDDEVVKAAIVAKFGSVENFAATL